MKRRIGSAAQTGLGGGGVTLMDGESTGNKELDSKVNQCARVVYEQFFKGTKLDYGCCDAQAREDEYRFGIEPTYQYDELKIIVVRKVKEDSYIETGYARESYGTGIQSKRKYYREYKLKSKFVRWVDQCHAMLFCNLST